MSTTATSSPILDRILAKFPDARRSGDGWEARCPAHEDRRSSLSISIGDDNRVLLFCHAGCAVQTIVEAIGLTVRDLFPPKANGSNAKPSNPTRSTYIAPAAAVRDYERKLGPHAAQWEYHNAAGKLVGVIVRWNTPDGKEIRPISRRENGIGWIMGGMPEPRPLYGLPTLAGAQCVYVVEGERCVDAARGIGLIATTSPHGAKSGDKADWQPLAGKDVPILIDNDAAGRNYGDTVATILAKLDPPATPRIVELPGLPPGGDIVDWIAAHGDAAEPDSMKAEIEAIIAAAPEWTAPAADSTSTAKVKSTAPPPVAVGTWVRAADRENYGQVTDDLGDRCAVHFVSREGQAADKEFLKSELFTQDGKPLASSTEPPRFITALVTSQELVDVPADVVYLVQDSLTAGEPGAVAGPVKCLKTLTAVDLAVSTASGQPFLSYFQVPKPGPVAFLSGESGRAVLRRAFIRIAQSKGVDPRRLPITWGFSLPQLTAADHLDALGKRIKADGHVLVILDPTYLCLLNAQSAGQAGNLFAMGAALAPLSDIVQDTGATILLLHHYRKNRADNGGEPAGLEEMAMSGMAEWSRQWLLLDRQEPYQNDGIHKLWLRAGGSAGHAGLYGLTIDEGTGDSHRWITEVQRVGDVRAELKTQRENKRAADQERREDDYRHRLLDAIRQFPDGAACKTIRNVAGLNADNFSKAVLPLIKEGRAELCETPKGKRGEWFRPCKQ